MSSFNLMKIGFTHSNINDGKIIKFYEISCMNNSMDSHIQEKRSVKLCKWYKNEIRITLSTKDFGIWYFSALII